MRSTGLGPSLRAPRFGPFDLREQQLHQRRAGLVAAVLTVALTVACSGTSTTASSDLPSATSPPRDGSVAPGSTSDGTSAGSTPAFTPKPIDEWTPCGTGAQCAKVEVPLDYSKPDGPTIELALKRLPATDPDARIGSLFVNPGGPGASGVEAVASIAGSLGSDVRAHFDVVGWDPRGIGDSEPLGCESSVIPFYEQDLSKIPAGPDADAAAKAIGKECEQSNGDLLPFVGTIDVARDLESLRQAVGDDKLNYAGFSYGSQIGLVYAALFPTHIRAMLIDGIVDPTLTVSEQIVTQSKAVDDVLAKFIASCDAKPNCKPTPDTATAITQVLDRSRTDPQTARIMGKPVPFGPTFVSFGIIVATYDSTTWNVLGRALQAAQNGDISQLSALSNAYLTGASSTANLAVNCLDAVTPTGDAYTEMVRASAQAAPLTGAFNANLGLPCAFWPTPPKPLPTSYAAPGSPAIEVWGTTGDNATPYANAVKVAGLLDRGVLVTLEADQHTAVGANECVIDWQSRYLISQETPPEGTRC